MELNEQVSRMKGLIYELSPKSTGVQEFIQKVKDTPGLLKFLNFKTYKSLEEYITDGDYNDMVELKKDAEKFFKKKSSDK
jgi:hypothetical protein